MPELKAAFIESGYADVCTHLNSGSVMFSSEEADTVVLAERIKELIAQKFSLDIPVFVIPQNELRNLKKLKSVRMLRSGLLIASSIQRQTGGKRQRLQELGK